MTAVYMQSANNRLYLVPAPLSQVLPDNGLLPEDRAVVAGLRHWLVETPKTARAWLKLYEIPVPLAELDVVAIADFNDIGALMDWLKNCTGAVGVMSDAGCPGVADPGAVAVDAAHRLGWDVHPMVGASSILLALMGSGMSGQRFVFHGYLPIDSQQRAQFLKDAEATSARLQQTQIAIETPYRNAQLVSALCSVLKPDTRLCIASELRGPNQWIRTQPVARWKSAPPDLGKQASLFLWLAEPDQTVNAGATVPTRPAKPTRQTSRRRA